MNVHLDRVTRDFLAPRIEPLLELGARQHATCVQHEFVQQIELPRLQLDRLRPKLHGACGRIETQRTDCEYRRGLASRATDQRAQACGEFVEIDGLLDLVVGAGIEAPDAVIDRIPRRQDEHRRSHPPRALARDQRQAVDARQPEIDDSGREGGTAERELRGDAVADPVDVESTLAQPGLQRIAEQRIVFDDEDAHSLANRRGASCNRSPSTRPDFRDAGNC
jgi:hypothetical protein